MARRPAKGYTHNPLRSIAPNSRCPCRSDRKFKVCCFHKLPEFVTEELAKQYRIQMTRPDFAFMTEENQEVMNREICERRARCPHEWDEVKVQAAGSHPGKTVTVCKLCFIDKALLEAALRTMDAEPVMTESP